MFKTSTSSQFQRSRRALLLGVAGIALGGAGLSGCLRKKTKSADGRGGVDEEGSLAWAVAGQWRTPTDKARDQHRHPIEMIDFFGITPKDRVIDMWPGSGYMTEILAPFLSHGNGQYIAAMFESRKSENMSMLRMNEHFMKHFESDEKLYGKMEYSQFGSHTGFMGEPQSVDFVLFLLRVQDWMAAGIAEKAFNDAYAVLKPGGILGVEQHRADIGNIQDPAASNGYVQELFINALASEAGFRLVDSSEINANPKDSKDYPFGVWTLPPQSLTAPRGQAPNPEFDGSLYLSIGESDRMTMKFQKPR